jgi:hypothetical protein
MAKATLNLKELYDDGFCHGQDLFQYNYRDVKITEDMDVDEFRDKVFDVCGEADYGYRQYSPFEFFAYELNTAENSEEAWEAYEKGIWDGVADCLDDLLANEEAFEELKRGHKD